MVTSIANLYSHGHPFNHEGCPDPKVFDIVDPNLAASVFACKTAAREQWIASYLEANPIEPRFVAAMKHDMEQAKMTTNRDQLEELNIMVPTPSMISKRSDEWCHTKLWNIIYGLARLGIFLQDTDHLTDRDFLTHLGSHVLADKISDLPPNPDMSEFIAANPTGIPPLMIDGVPFVRHLPTPDRSHFDTDTI
jgi:hypothetical protein